MSDAPHAHTHMRAVVPGVIQFPCRCRPEAGASSDTEELERAVAPHLPLLHHALLRSEQPDPADYDLPILVH